jgi:crotonobetainyl-CoA:carnitine CoA-transferase CaiB-like acyl-CoA transferase
MSGFPNALRPPLDGIRVVDLTRILSGPFCTMMLGDMGADVVKVEGVNDGDPIRDIGEQREGLSWYFASFNRNKRSITLDLRSPEGLAVLGELLAKADVLVENYKPGVLARMGFTESRLRELNPRLIITSINGYGSTGPYADRPAFDFVTQAMSGFMSVNGDPHGAPMRSGPPITDLVAGLYAAFGTVNALRARDLNGIGQRVEASMMGGIMSMFAFLAADHLATGKIPQRQGNDHPISSPYGIFSAADGDLAVAPSTEAVLRKFLAALDLSHLLSQPEFATNALRVKNRRAVHALVDDRLRQHPRAYWLRTLNDAGVPCGIVQDLHHALNDPQAQHQEWVIDVEHPGHGTVRMLGFATKLSDTPAAVRRPAPEHGAHSAEVLKEWGVRDARPRQSRDENRSSPSEAS